MPRGGGRSHGGHHGGHGGYRPHGGHGGFRPHGGPGRFPHHRFGPVRPVGPVYPVNYPYNSYPAVYGYPYPDNLYNLCNDPRVPLRVRLAYCY